MSAESDTIFECLDEIQAELATGQDRPGDATMRAAGLAFHAWGRAAPMLALRFLDSMGNAPSRAILTDACATLAFLGASESLQLQSTYTLFATLRDAYDDEGARTVRWQTDITFPSKAVEFIQGFGPLRTAAQELLFDYSIHLSDDWADACDMATDSDDFDDIAEKQFHGKLNERFANRAEFYPLSCDPQACVAIRSALSECLLAETLERELPEAPAQGRPPRI